MSDAMQIAERVYALALEQNDAALMIGANRALATKLYWLGDFESSRQYAVRGVQIWRSGNVESHAEEYYTPIVGCLVYMAVRVASRGHRLLRSDYWGSNLSSKDAK